MSLGEALKAELTMSTVTAIYLVPGGGLPDRVYPLIIPQQKKNGPAQVPAVVYAINGAERQLLYCGTSNVIRSRLQIDCYDLTYEGARELADAVRETLQDFSGLLGAIVEVRNAALETEIDLQDIDPGLYRVSQSWAFWHVE
ncbi:MAG: hypothetical protein ABI661_04945 [Gammaproteobacteria bacterium]